MKKLIVLYFLLTGMYAVAQKSVEALINAEKNFAAYSVANSVRDAFIKFLDSTGIVFEQGQPVNGIEAWNKKEKRAGILNLLKLLPQMTLVIQQGHGPFNQKQ